MFRTYLIYTDQTGYHAKSQHRSETNAIRTARRLDRGAQYTGVRVVMLTDGGKTDIYPAVGPCRGW